jgi:signal transduction histidine kinase
MERDAHAAEVAAEGPWSPRWQRRGLLWVAATIPVGALAAAFVDTPTGYVLVLMLLGFGPYTLPGAIVGHHAVRGAAPDERLGYRLLHLGLLATIVVGLVQVVALLAGWKAALWAAPPGFGLAGGLMLGGLIVVVRRRSAYQSLSVDVAETLASVVAVCAPLAVLWGPAILAADDAWFTTAAAVAFVLLVATAYWVALLAVRLGPRPWGSLEAWEVAAALVVVLTGTATAGLQVAQGVSGFDLPGPPLVAFCGVCASAYLLIPLFAPVRFSDGLAGVPPEDQVRGGWLPTAVPLVGIAALLAATAAVADERTWAVPFAFAVVALLAVLAAVRQVASMHEARRLYHQVGVAAGERRRLLTELLEQSVHDRRAVVERLHSEAMSAYASFTALAATDRPAEVRARASAVVGDDLRRQAESLHELVQSMRSRDRGRPGRQLVAPVRAYLATTYGDRPPPSLTVRVADDLRLDWVVETIALQVVQEALHNVWRHSGATAVEVDIYAMGGVVIVEVVDDGDGFDGARTPEAGGIGTMRAAAAVVDGQVNVESTPGAGARVVARLGTHGPAPEAPLGRGAALRPHLHALD